MFSKRINPGSAGQGFKRLFKQIFIYKNLFVRLLNEGLHASW